MIVNGTMLKAGVEDVVPASRLVRNDKTNVAVNTMIYGLFCDFKQLTDVSGQPIGIIFKDQARRKFIVFRRKATH